MIEPREECSCGRWPRFLCHQVAEDQVQSTFSCQCGKAGPDVEDAFADRRTAASVWDAMRRRERREQ